MTAYVRNHFGRHAADTDPGEDWRAEAACLDTDPELFFPFGDGRAARVQEELAVAVCRRCQVWEQCLVGALASRDGWSVRGGLTAKQRSQFELRDGKVAPKPSGFRCRRCGGPLPDGATGNTKFCPSCRAKPGPKVAK